MKFSLLVFALAYGTTNAFVAPQPVAQQMSRVVVLAAAPSDKNDDQPFKRANDDVGPGFWGDVAPKAALATTAMWTATAELASAAGPDWGIFEGRIGSLLHPIAMLSMFLYSAYTAFLGFQWRRQRTLGDDISALKKSLPDMGGASSVAEAVAAAEEAGDSSKVAALKAAQSTEDEIKALQQERKDLAAAGPRDRHFAQGALLAFIGTSFAIVVRCVTTA